MNGSRGPKGTGLSISPTPDSSRHASHVNGVNERPKFIEQMRIQLPEKSAGMVDPVSEGMPIRWQRPRSNDEVA